MAKMLRPDYKALGCKFAKFVLLPAAAARQERCVKVSCDIRSVESQHYIYNFKKD